MQAISFTQYIGGGVMLLNRSNGLYNMLLRKTEFTGLQLDVWQQILGQRR